MPAGCLLLRLLVSMGMIQLTFAAFCYKSCVYFFAICACSVYMWSMRPMSLPVLVLCMSGVHIPCYYIGAFYICALCGVCISCHYICALCGVCISCHYDGLVQDCSNSIASSLELLQSSTKPSITSVLVLCLSGVCVTCHYICVCVEHVSNVITFVQDLFKSGACIPCHYICASLYIWSMCPMPLLLCQFSMFPACIPCDYICANFLYI